MQTLAILARERTVLTPALSHQQRASDAGYLASQHFIADIKKAAKSSLLSKQIVKP